MTTPLTTEQREAIYMLKEHRCDFEFITGRFPNAAMRDLRDMVISARVKLPSVCSPIWKPPSAAPPKSVNWLMS